MDRFENQVAVITGGAQGIGASISIRLAREGARVVVFDRDEKQAENAVTALTRDGLRAEAMAVDVTDEAAVSAGFQTVVDRYGRVDIMINSAGIVGPNATNLADTPTEGWDEVIRVNLRGSFLAAKYAVRAMLPRDYGRILLIASIAGKEGNAGMCGYSASKAGVIGLVKSAGKEYAETGITVNGLAPAVIETAMVANMNPSQVKYMTDRIPMKRCGTLEEIAAMSAWIVSPEAAFNTGFIFDLSGGRAVY
jgi:3-oxoacyl-[acyl-carrier protein] reductase